LLGDQLKPLCGAPLLNDRHPRPVIAYRRSKGLALVAGASLESFGHDRSAEMFFTRRSLPTVLLPILVAGSVNAQPDPKGIAKAATPSDPFALVKKEQWRADLHFLARELPKRHANAFHHTARERFDAEVADLDGRIDTLNADEIYVGLDRIANLVGDGHTFVEFPDDKARLPVQIKQFGGEYRVTAVAPGMEKALGARVLRIHDTPIARAHELLLTLTPQDETPFLSQARVEAFLTLGIVLHGYGIIPDRRIAKLALADEAGREFIVEARAIAPNEGINWVPVFKELPLFRQRPGETC
jgi:hypothetical protein